MVPQPIWAIMREEGRTLRWLARRMRYNERHIYSVKSLHRPATAQFRQRAALALGRPESELFTAGETAREEVTA